MDKCVRINYNNQLSYKDIKGTNIINGEGRERIYGLENVKNP